VTAFSRRPEVGWLASGCWSAFAGRRLQDRVVTQTRVVVAVLVAGHQAEQPLTHPLHQVMLDLAGLAVVGEAPDKCPVCGASKDHFFQIQ